MRIGLTGGTGFIGKYLLRDHAEKYDFVVATSRDSLRAENDHIRFVKTDYSEESFKECFSGCDAVIHLGGYVQHGMDRDIIVEPYLSNISLAHALFEACRKNGITNVVSASSIAAYGHVTSRAVTESDMCRPVSVYGLVKLATDNLAYIYNDRYGMKIKCLRYAQGLGKVTNLEDGRFWAVLQKKCLMKQPIEIWGSGEIGRDLIYVRDMAASAISAIQHPEHKGIYNIGSGVSYTNLAIAKLYCKIFDNPAGIQFVKPEYSKAEYSWMDCSKAKNELGFSVGYSLEAMIKDIREEWMRDA